MMLYQLENINNETEITFQKPSGTSRVKKWNDQNQSSLKKLNNKFRLAERKKISKFEDKSAEIMVFECKEK